MAQVNVSKEVAYVQLGPPAGTAAVPKLVAYVWLIPGQDDAGTTTRQGHVYGIRIGGR